MGIDSGGTGGIVAQLEGADVISLGFKKNSPRDIHDWLTDIPLPSNSFCLIERVHSMPGQGIASTFKFGENYGLIQGLIIAMGIPYDFVSPNKWQTEVGTSLTAKQKESIKSEILNLEPEKQSKKEKYLRRKAIKNNAKIKAQQLFPKSKITLENADAFLILECSKKDIEGGKK